MSIYCFNCVFIDRVNYELEWCFDRRLLAAITMFLSIFCSTFIIRLSCTFVAAVELLLYSSPSFVLLAWNFMYCKSYLPRNLWDSFLSVISIYRVAISWWYFYQVTPSKLHLEFLTLIPDHLITVSLFFTMQIFPEYVPSEFPCPWNVKLHTCLSIRKI